ncbi:MAG: hypothetical protein BroJett011_70540 [Chloroflexota bacterium]|nr:MAG: hypothetical protein BroJett011_70540 [Chloroflexota bacterium]
MTILEQIQQQLEHLPPEKQSEVLDFAAFLRQQLADTPPSGERSLRRHPAFGSWHEHNIDALSYQESLRAEWEGVRVSYQV